MRCCPTLIIRQQFEEKHIKACAEASSQDDVSVWNATQSQTFSMAISPHALCHLSEWKSTAQPLAIPRVCHSCCLHACLGMSQGGLTRPSLDPTAYMTALLKASEGVERGLGAKRGTWWEGDTDSRRGEKGRDLRRKGKCGSTQSKPCHMFQSAGISPPVQTRMLCKRLLIRASACRKAECQLGLRHLAGLSATMLSHGITAWKVDALGYCWRC